MNGEQQKKRHTSVEELRTDIGEVATAVEQLVAAEIIARREAMDFLKQEMSTMLIESITAEGRARAHFEHKMEALNREFRTMPWWIRIKWALFNGVGY